MCRVAVPECHGGTVGVVILRGAIEEWHMEGP